MARGLRLWRHLVRLNPAGAAGTVRRVPPGRPLLAGGLRASSLARAWSMKTLHQHQVRPVLIGLGDQHAVLIGGH